MSRDVKFFEQNTNQVIEKPDIINRSAFSPKNLIDVPESVTDDDDSESESSDEDEEEFLSYRTSEDASASGGDTTSNSDDARETSQMNVFDESQCQDDLNSTPHANESMSLVNETFSTETNGNASNINELSVVETESHVESSEGMDSTENSLYDSFQDVDYEVAASEYACICVSDVDSSGPRHVGLMAALSVGVSEPTTIQQALHSADKDAWKQAMVDEYNALIENDTWELADLPAGRKAIDCKWVFKVKRNAVGTIMRHKARLVVKGYSQVKGIDYDETYSPVARYSSIRFLIAMSVKYGMAIHQMDAITAFLQGELSEEIYMRQPMCFSDKTNRVCRLRKSIYGLKQSSRVWNKKLTSVLTQQLGFTQSSVDQCIFFKHSVENTIIIAIYVDDMLIFGSNPTMITKLKKALMNHFKMNDMGEVSSILGMNVVRNRDGSISIDQRQYLCDILQRFQMSDCKPTKSPMDTQVKLSMEMCPKNEVERAVFGSLSRSGRLHYVCSANKSSRHRIRCKCTEPI